MPTSGRSSSAPASLRARDGGSRPGETKGNLNVYFTDRGIEELEKRRGEEEVTFEWLAEQLRAFVDLNPDFEVPVERLATWLARLDDEDEDEE